MQQSSATPKNRDVGRNAEDCCMLSILLAVPSCTYSFWHGVIPTSYFIFNDFYTCFTQIFYAGLAFVERGEMVPVPVHPRTYAHAYYICALDINMRSRSRAPYRVPVPWPASKWRSITRKSQRRLGSRFLKVQSGSCALEIEGVSCKNYNL